MWNTHARMTLLFIGTGRPAPSIDRVSGNGQRQTSGLLSNAERGAKQKRRVCGCDAIRAGLCAPRVSLLGRAILQSHVRRDAHRTGRPCGALQYGVRSLRKQVYSEYCMFQYILFLI